MTKTISRNKQDLKKIAFKIIKIITKNGMALLPTIFFLNVNVSIHNFDPLCGHQMLKVFSMLSNYTKLFPTCKIGLDLF
jgi:hypothetical protein